MDFEKYLSDTELKDIASEEWRSMCRSYFSEEKATKISNVAYHHVQDAIDEALDGRADELIAEKAIDVINGMSSYTVFHKPDVYDNKPSESWKLLQKIIKDNEGILQEVIRHHIHNLSKHDALEIIKSATLTINTGK